MRMLYHLIIDKIYLRIASLMMPERLGMAKIFESSWSAHGWEGARRASVVQIETKLELGCLRHAPGIPRRIQDYFDANLFHLRQPCKFAFDVSFQHIAHAAARSRHRHLHIDSLSALLERRDHTGVDQAQV